MQGVRKGLPVFGFIGNYKSRLLYDDFRLQPLIFAAGKDMLMDDSKNSGMMFFMDLRTFFDFTDLLCCVYNESIKGRGRKNI